MFGLAEDSAGFSEYSGFSARIPFFFIVAAAGLTAGLGLTVLIGWHLRNPALIQVYSDFMPYNTALGFVLCGGGLLALAGGKYRPASACGVILAVTGSATLLQYIFAVDFGIDQVFMEHYITVKTAHPGRMAPITAVSFVLSGMGLTALGGWRNRAQRLPGILASLVMAIGMGTFMGYALGTEAPYGWSDLSYMAIHTAGGFIVLGAGMFAHVLRNAMARRPDPPRWLPVTAGIFLLTILVGLWQALVTQENKQIHRVVEARAENLAGRIGESIDATTKALERMAKRWETRGATPWREWEADATRYVTDYPGFRAIQWVDSDDRLRWIIPVESTESQGHFKFSKSGKGISILKNAIKRGQTVVTEPAELEEGGMGFLIYVPVFAEGRFKGFITGIFRIGEMISHLVYDGTEQIYQTSFRSDGKEIFQTPDRDNIDGSVWARDHTVRLKNVVWLVRVQPRSDYLSQLRSGIADVVLIVGLLIIVLSILLIERAQTARRSAREFHESETRFRHLADAASDWFWETDPDFLCTWVSFDVHPLWGAPRSEVVGHPAWAWPGMELEDSESVTARLNDLAREQRSFRNIVIHAKYPGFDARDISISGVPIFDGNGKFIGYRGACTDITRQLEVENQLRQSQKMEAVGQLTGGVAHDFNNLLTVTMNNAELLELQLRDRDDLHAMARSIVKASERGSELTHRLLAFSRKQTLQPKILQLGELCRETNNLLRRSLSETIDIEITIDDELWNVLADPGEIESALLNLAINASHAMPRGGKLGITVENVAVTDRAWAGGWEGKTGDYVALRVTDSGTGMSDDVLEHAFEPFFTTKEIGEGSGLGLSMVHGFAQQSGGFATIESELTKGTIVTIYLPRVYVAHADPESDGTAAELPTGDGEIILVVEDEEAVRDSTIKLLETLGYRVLSAENGAEGVALASNANRIDLMISDVVLPGGMNGIEAYKVIIRQRPDLKCLFMSGYTSKFDQDLPQGALLLKKPIRLEEFARNIRKFLDA